MCGHDEVNYQTKMVVLLCGGGMGQHAPSIASAAQLFTPPTALTSPPLFTECVTGNRILTGMYMRVLEDGCRR